MITRKHSEGTEYSHRDMQKVRAVRRSFIARGYVVSLIGYDGSRGVYAFDVCH
jgi:hypothetical protein